MASSAMASSASALSPSSSAPPQVATASRSSFLFPFAAAPDIIRSNQKDAYYQGLLLDQLSAILRKLYGARILHKYMLEAKTLSELLYLGLTTFRNARTLGEEYCDIIHVESDTLRTPSLERRGGFLVTTVLFPYLITKTLPKVRMRLRQRLSAGKQTKLKTYLLENLDVLTSTSNLLAVHLGVFYFSGAYYHLSKRLWGLRYIFTHRLLPHEERGGYEVLGVLLLCQLAAQGYFHLSSTFSNAASITEEEDKMNKVEGGGTGTNPRHEEDTGRNRTDVVGLEDESVMGFMQGEMGRKCTLCLEVMKDPTATGCGHVFCWSCVSEWCRSKPECPLCRQTALVQHLLPLRA